MNYTFEELIEEKLSAFENATGMFLHKNRELVKWELVGMCKNIKTLTIAECGELLRSTEEYYYGAECLQQINEFTIEI